jgi:hypothetical protein
MLYGPNEAERVNGISRHEIRTAHIGVRLGFRAKIHQNRSAAGEVASLDIVEDISHEPRPVQVEAEVVGSAQ